MRQAEYRATYDAEGIGEFAAMGMLRIADMNCVPFFLRDRPSSDCGAGCSLSWIFLESQTHSSSANRTNT